MPPTPPSPKSGAPKSERPVLLPQKVSVVALADVCRATTLEFMNGAGGAWQKRELASWLAGPYRALTSLAQRQQRESERMINVLARVAVVRPVRLAAKSPEISERRIADLLASARAEVGATLEGLRDCDVGVGFVFDVLGAGLVQRCVDRDGEAGWVPLDLPRQRLADRVASLIAVDYLLRAEDYEQKLATCAACGLVSFEDDRHGARACPRNVSESGIPGPRVERVTAA